MKLDNLFRSMKAGGLGVTHIFLFRFVLRFLFFGDQENSFIIPVIHTQLAGSIPGFIVSSCENVCARLFGYLKEVLQSVAFLNGPFSKEYWSGVNRTRWLKHLRDTPYPVPLYRQHLSDGSGQVVLCRVRRMCVPPRVK